MTDIGKATMAGATTIIVGTATAIGTGAIVIADANDSTLRYETALSAVMDLGEHLQTGAVSGGVPEHCR